eukprot:XP_001691555.1 predicted protein [Chlamydomonas reinhardtii]
MLEQNQQQLQLSRGLEAHLGTMLDEPPLKLAKAPPEPKPGSTTPPASSAMGAGKGLDAIAGLRPQLMTAAVRHAASGGPPDKSGARHRNDDPGASETRDNTKHAPVSLRDKQRNSDAELVGASAGVRISSGGGNGVRRDSGSSSGGVPAHAQALLLPHLSQPPSPAAARGNLLNSSATETRGLHAKGTVPSAAAATAAAARLRPRSSRHTGTFAGGSLQQQQQQPMLLRDRIRRHAHRHVDGGVLVASGSHLEIIASQQPAAAAAALRACGKADVGFASPVAAAAAGITNTAPQLEMEYAAGNSRDGSGGSRSSNSSSFGALAQLGSRNSSSPHFPSSPTTAGGPSSPLTLLRTQSSHEQLPPSPHISSSLRRLAAPAALNGACALATAPQVSAGLPIAAAAAPPLRLLLPPALPPLAPNTAGTSRNTFAGGVGIRLSWPQQHPQQATASVGGTAGAGAPFTQQWRPCAQQAQHQQQPAAAAHDGGGHVVAAAVHPVGGGAAAGANYARTSSEQLDSINFDSVLWQLDENELDAILFK